MSDHSCPIVRVTKRPHPNADTLSLVDVLGFTVAVRTEDWQDGQLGVYIPPDSVVDTTQPEFAFLGEGRVRIKVKKLRGLYSQGLLVPAREGWEEGGDAAPILNVLHYEPTMQVSGGEATTAPAGFRPVYDVENWRKRCHVFEPGEAVVITEKIHGANSRFSFVDGEMHCGSREEWKRRAAGTAWWEALKATPGIEAWCRANPGATLYGEIYGNVQKLKYGVNGIAFAAFDAFNPMSRTEPDAWEPDYRYGDTGWMIWPYLADSCATHGVPMVPTLYAGPLPEDVTPFAEGPSTIKGANHMREGCCVRPLTERWDHRVGRVHLKVIGNGYLEKAA